MRNDKTFRNVLYVFIIIVGLTISCSGMQDYYNKWSEKGYRFNEPKLHKLKGKSIESHRFLFSEYAATTVVKITKDNGKYILSGNETTGYYKDCKAIRIEAVISEKEWSTLVKYIENISYDSYLYDRYDYESYSTSSIILESVKNDTYKMKLYSIEDKGKGNSSENFLQSAKIIKKFFYKILKDNKRKKIVVDLEIEYKKRKREEELRRKLQEEERARLYAQEQIKYRERKLWLAAKKGSRYTLSPFKGFNVNMKNDEGKTPLMIAVQNGYTHIIESLSKGKVNVWEKDNEGRTAFDYIKKANNKREKIFSNRMYRALRMLEIKQIIGKKGKIVSSSSGHNGQNISIVIEGAKCDDFVFSKHTECVSVKPKKTMGTSKEIYEDDIKRGVPAIFAAIQNKFTPQLIEMLDIGTDIETKNKFGATPLGFASASGFIEESKLLLEHGANPNVMDGNGIYTPLSRAALNNNIPMVELLLEHGAEINFQYKKSETPLTMASKGCKNFEMVRILLDKGADSNLIDIYGNNTKTALTRYCRDEEGKKKMMEILDPSWDWGIIIFGTIFLLYFVRSNFNR